MQNASDQNLKQNVHIKSCECECLYYKDCVTSSIGDSTGIGLGFYFWVFSNQTTNFKKISLTHFCTVKCNVWNDWNCFFHIIRKAHKTESPVFSICWCGWCWVITLPLPITLAVLRPAWGSLQLFRAIKLNKMEPRCDHRAHSDHIVTIVFLVFRAHDSAPHWPRVWTRTAHDQHHLYPSTFYWPQELLNFDCWWTRIMLLWVNLL